MPQALERPLPLCLFAALALAGCSATTAPTTTTTTSTSTSTTTNTTTTAIASLQPYSDSTGAIATYVSSGSIDTTSTFFQPLGTNGRTCATCHQPAQGMSLNPTAIQALYASSSGADPLFASIDGANYPTASAGDATARTLLLNSGLIRIAITLPTSTQFNITALSDPYGCAIVVDPVTGAKTISVYRRPLPTSSIDYLSNIMWDTRETIQPLTAAATFSTNLQADLTQQAVDAVSTHAQGATTPTTTQTSALIAFMQQLNTAQATDILAGSLSANGATGGPTNLAAAPYHPGINDAFGQDPSGARFNPQTFNLYSAWANSSNAQQASIARGEGIFNTAGMAIANVRGINDNPALGSPTVLQGSCGTCHDTPNIGNHSLPLPMDTAVSRLSAYETDPATLAGVTQLSSPALPIFRITGCTDSNGNPVTYTTTDPGHALNTGLCADINRVKVPILRGLAARGPYFHNGSATTLAQLVAFYNARFQMRLSPPQQADLVNFLNAL